MSFNAIRYSRLEMKTLKYKINVCHVKIRKRSKIRNRYNQAPDLTQDTNGKVAIFKLNRIDHDEMQRQLVIINKKAHGPWIAHPSPCHEERVFTTKYINTISPTPKSIFGYHSDHNQATPVTLFNTDMLSGTISMSYLNCQGWS